MIRVALSAALGALLAFGGPRLLGLDPRLGLAGLTLGSGLAGWLEMLLLRARAEPARGEDGPAGLVLAPGLGRGARRRGGRASA